MGRLRRQDRVGLPMLTRRMWRIVLTRHTASAAQPMTLTGRLLMQRASRQSPLGES
jgi:hypothetical protein